MPRITLPDGKTLDFDRPVTGLEVAERIGPRLAKDAVGVKVNGELMDLARPIEQDATVSIVTPVTRAGEPDADALYLLRHSCAHVMAEAIERLKPGIQLVYGPPVDNGFFYDIAFPDGETLSSDEFAEVERLMQAIIAEDRPFSRYDLSLDEGLSKLRQEGSKFKLDNAERAVEAGATTLSWYATGEPGKHWEDLCRGPHVPSTGRIGAFKVMSVASSYWHGDAESDRLIRVYGTAFPRPKDLDQYLNMMEEARKRDHRVLGRKLNLFTTDEKVGPGLILWMPRGGIVRREMEEFIRAARDSKGFVWVNSPHVGKLDLYRTSGHFPYYRDSQYPPLVSPEEISASLIAQGSSCGCAEVANAMTEHSTEGYLLKPMNCPHHIRIFQAEPHSYRDLPVRFAEFGTVYRFEQSGEICGMTRCRGFTQDDSHIFCTPEQLADEIMLDVSLARMVLEELGLEYRVQVSTRDKDGAKWIGPIERWEAAQEELKKAAAAIGVPWSVGEGDAAFYGPKIDFIAKDSIGREWQLGTVQLDYNLPERFELTYIGADNQPHRPIMIHCAPFGSLERFLGLMIEHHAGIFPLWLAPEQARILPISDKFMDYAERVRQVMHDRAKAMNPPVRLRVDVDRHAERVQAKIKTASEMKVPYMFVVGGRDAEANTVSVRHLTEGDLGSIPVDELADLIVQEVATRGRVNILGRMKGGVGGSVAEEKTVAV